MTEVTFIPPKEYHLTPVWGARLIKRARNDAQIILQRSRNKAARYLRNVRKRGREAGFKEGLELARAELQLILNDFNERLNERIDIISTQVGEGALALAEQVVGAELRIRESAYQIWLQEALHMLRREQDLVLYCSPQQEKMMLQLTKNISPELKVHPDPNVSAPDIIIHSSLGKIGFGWREALELAAANVER